VGGVARGLRAVTAVSSLVALLTAVNGHQALAGSWTRVSLPNISERPDDPELDGTRPYTLRWPGEGTTDSGSNDCDPTPPWKMGRRARSDLLGGVTGIIKKGEFWKQGSYTSTDGGNHLAFFFHQEQCFNGGAEYGLTRKLHEGNATLYLYQCGNCNTGNTLYTRTGVWSYAGADRIYGIEVQTDGDFHVKVYKTILGGGRELVHSQVVSRATWMPNLNGASGYITANAHTGDPATPDSYDGSYNQVDTLWYVG
jgi:hypothetical protein